tara:strand:- start:74 stop:634 length:561 start_codon:yes stop_codon:yes gene_type:complete
MFIQTESTPNPNSLKFILENYQLCKEPREFDNLTSNSSKLAEKLFKIEGVEKIFFNENVISINKNKYTWDQLKASILQVISDFIHSGLHPVDDSDQEIKNDNEIKFNEVDKEIVSNINTILETKVRPAIMQDGGDIKFKSYDEGIVYLTLQGSCAGCPSATLTLKNGVENLLKHHIPEIKKVEQVV